MICLSLSSSIQSCPDGPTWTVCWSPCGTKLAAAGADRIIHIYSFLPDTQELKLEAELKGAHTKTIRCLDWHFNLLAAASFDGTISIWSHTQSWKCVATLEGHENEVKAVRFSPDGRRLASCGRDRTVWIWSVLRDSDEYEFECEAVLHEHAQDVKTIIWHPSSNILFTAGYDDKIVLFGCPLDEDEWLCLGKLSGHSSTVWALAYHNNYLYSASDDKSIMRWRDVNATSIVFNINLQIDCQFRNVHEEAIYCMDVYDSCIVTGGADCKLILSDSETGSAISNLLLPCQINAVKSHPTLRLFVAALDNGQVAIIKTGHE